LTHHITIAAQALTLIIDDPLQGAYLCFLGRVNYFKLSKREKYRFTDKGLAVYSNFGFLDSWIP